MQNQPAVQEPSSGHSKAGPIVLLALGGVGIAVGSVFGVVALNTNSSLQNDCGSNKVCPASSQNDINALPTQELISTIGFGVGVVAVAGGAVWWMLSGTKEEPRPRTGVTPLLGPGLLGVGGRF